MGYEGVIIARTCFPDVIGTTCNNFENRQQIKFFADKMNVNRDFALAREALHNYKNAYFSKILLDLQDFLSDKSFVSLYKFLAIIMKY